MEWQKSDSESNRLFSREAEEGGKRRNEKQKREGTFWAVGDKKERK